MAKGFTRLTTEEQKDLLALIRAAYHAEREADLEARNAVARVIFKNKGWRKVMLTAKSGVETWHDGQSKNWITMCVDSDGDQVGNSNYTGHRDDAAVAHLWALNSIVKEEILNGQS